MHVIRIAPRRDRGPSDIASKIQSMDIRYRPPDECENEPLGMIEIAIQQPGKDRITIRVPPNEILLMLAKVPPGVVEGSFDLFRTCIEADAKDNEEMERPELSITSEQVSTLVATLLSSALNSYVLTSRSR